MTSISASLIEKYCTKNFLTYLYLLSNADIVACFVFLKANTSNKSTVKHNKFVLDENYVYSIYTALI